MNNKPEIGLITALMMFPQIVETIYSPVLPNIASAFDVSEHAASQTLSIYFIAFAFGVVVWGRLADVIGRRPAMLLGLMSYGIGTIIALYSVHFEWLLLARSLSAFGAAVGSIITQTMLRDSFQGPELAKVFSIMGIGIGVSPVVGLISGSVLTSIWGYQGVFSALALLAGVLLGISIWRLPETQASSNKAPPLLALSICMAKDLTLWRSAVLVASFNLMLFSYYSLAPFIFNQLGFSTTQFGTSGIVIALAVLCGSALNKFLLTKGWRPERLISLASLLALVGAIGVCLGQNSLLFLLPMGLTVIGFGIAIPNILSQALTQYKDAAGSAGALFGLAYYLMLGAGLALAAISHNLAQVLLASATLACGLSFKKCY
ncbi:multidrug effflux MFS transporter [Shewanella sp. 0m-11]